MVHKNDETQYSFGYCTSYTKGFNSELTLKYEITHYPLCGKKIDEEYESSELVWSQGSGEDRQINNTFEKNIIDRFTKHE